MKPFNQDFADRTWIDNYLPDRIQAVRVQLGDKHLLHKKHSPQPKHDIPHFLKKQAY